MCSQLTKEVELTNKTMKKLNSLAIKYELKPHFSPIGLTKLYMTDNTCVGDKTRKWASHTIVLIHNSANSGNWCNILIDSSVKKYHKKILIYLPFNTDI